MKFTKKLNCFALLGAMSLPGCGSGELLDALAEASQLQDPNFASSGVGIPTNNQNGSQNYLQTGFSTQDGLRLVQVLTDNSEGITDSHRTSNGESLTASYDATAGTLRIRSAGVSRGGDFDAEAVTFSNLAQHDIAGNDGHRYIFYDNDGNANGINQAFVVFGDHGYAVHANLDQDDGPFRHNASFIDGGGTPNSALPSATATYTIDGNATLEIQEGTSNQRAFQQIPIDVFGNVDADFSSGNVTTSVSLLDVQDVSRLGQLSGQGRIIENGFRIDRTYGEVHDFGGRAVALSGQESGAFAGPNGEEVLGLFMATGSDSSNGVTTNMSLSGSYLGHR